ncbi:hypothetical protein MLD38_032972 [Melastoma candidum]|uniref:Uncharacterized protein n=1 Tax=Melastoma candidum TaxID=119954 RepID=A0ACB9M5V9_9MYRT|nr:hypothetical protein MLD38_032972 [Melastoma candidum]
MGWKENSMSAILLLSEPFYIVSTVLLTLLLPLAFLLLSRLSSASYFLSVSHDSSSAVDPYPVCYLLSLFVDTNPTLLLTLLSSIGIATLVHSLAGVISPTRSMHQPSRLYLAWVLACASQLFVWSICLWFEQSLASAYDDSSLADEMGLLTQFMFFLGLHDTMIYWCRVIVKPIVDETVLGFRREERWAERAAVVASFGGLWWWRLREEVEAVAVVADVKMELLMGVGWVDSVSWWLYYLTVAIGMVRVVKACSHLGLCLISRGLRKRLGDGYYMIGFGVWRSCKDEMLTMRCPECDPTTIVLPVYMVQA